MGAEQLISEGEGMDADSLWCGDVYKCLNQGSSTEGTKGS